MNDIKTISQIFLAVILFLVAAAATSFAQRSYENPRVTAAAERISGDRFRFSARTARGANVYAVNQPSRQMLDKIDQGLTDLFAIARKNNYRARTNYSDYSIYIANPDRTKNSDGNYSPDIAVSAAQYAGSIYDQGGFIYAAGMIVANNPCAFLIADHRNNLERVAEVVRFEGEHLILFHNDRRRYQQTADHSTNGGHPILN